MDAKPGMKIYLVSEVSHTGGPVSAFSNLESARKECMLLAKREVKSLTRMNRQIKWRGAKYVIAHERGRPPGFTVYCIEKDGKKYQRRYFEAEEYILDKPHKNWLRK